MLLLICECVWTTHWNICPLAVCASAETNNNPVNNCSVHARVNTEEHSCPQCACSQGQRRSAQLSTMPVCVSVSVCVCVCATGNAESYWSQMCVCGHQIQHLTLLASKLTDHGAFDLSENNPPPPPPASSPLQDLDSFVFNHRVTPLSSLLLFQLRVSVRG